MPTGYTAPIKDGIAFEEYVWGCARAFGALIMLRDEASDAPIPEFQPSDYHVNALREANAELARLNAMTPEDAALEEAKERVKARAERLRWQAESDALRTKYEEMLEMVNAWEPPTAEHAGLKTFMASQIQESIRFDCHDYTTGGKIPRRTGKQWLSENIAEVRRAISYNEGERGKELARVKSRNDWVKQLAASVPMPSKLKPETA